MSTTVPLKIEAHLVDGRIVSTDGIIMFDSVLYHAWFYKYAPQVLRGEYNEKLRNQHFGLPLAQLSETRYLASKAIYEESDVHIEYYNKRPDFFASDKIGYLTQNKGLISDSVGAYRAYRNPNVIRVIKNSKLTFFCNGNKEKIIDLLKYIPAVGKKPSMGWGIVDKWIVSEIDKDYSTFHPKYGLMRPVLLEEVIKYPDIDFEKYPIMNYGIKPPYWKSCNFKTCYVPINLGGVK